jgi:Ca2+-binding EF-hand superfamily protein
MRSFVISSLIIVVAATCCSAQAGNNDKNKNQPNKVPPPFMQLLNLSAENFIKRFDKNKDGFLTKDELPPRLAQFFEKADKNADGKLDVAEVDEMLRVLRQRFKPPGNNPQAKPGNRPEVERMVAQILSKMDKNNDGKISRAEAQGAIAANFDRIDTNKDGYVDKGELRVAVERFLVQKKAADAKQGPGAIPAANTHPDFDALERNADGRLTPNELKGTPLADLFDKMDSNKDGKIDRKEFEAYWKKEAEKKATEKKEP